MAGAHQLGPGLELIPDLVAELPTSANGLVQATADRGLGRG